ncbi:MAG: hypothetical protein ACK56F_09595, partial [bacterium]
GVREQNAAADSGQLAAGSGQVDWAHRLFSSLFMLPVPACLSHVSRINGGNGNSGKENSANSKK